MIELIIYIGTFSAMIYMLILLYLTIGIIRTKTEWTDEQPSVSVIIAAHNESQNIASCLDSILSQDYPHENIEIIVVIFLSHIESRKVQWRQTVLILIRNH